MSLLLTNPSLCFSSSLPPPQQSSTSFLHLKNLYQYNCMISGYSKNSHFYEAMDVFCSMLTTTELQPDNFTLPSVLKSCGGLSMVELGETVHGFGVKLGLDSDTFVGNSLVSMYGKVGRVADAWKVFERMPERSLVSWNSMISVLFENGLVGDGFELVRELVMVEGMRFDDATLVTVLPVCAAKGLVETGRLMHGLSVKLGLDCELRVNNALIDLYSKCGSVVEAWRLFGRSSIEKNVVSWNTMIGGCAKNGDVGGTFDLLREMTKEEDVKANEITVLNVLPACLDPSGLCKVKELHGYALRNGRECNELVSNALIAAYAKCGSLELAENVFYRMETKTVNSWNALIGGCAQNGDPCKAVELFSEMISTGIEPDWFSIGSLLLACSHLKLRQIGMSIHGFVQRKGLDVDSFIRISLISLYIQCGEPSKARVLFDAIEEERDVVSWNAMIAGYSQNDLPNETLELFRQMLRKRLEPTVIATTSAFVACAQLSALRLGKEMHCFALKADFTEDPRVCCSIIDMYAKCGSIELSSYFFDEMNSKDLISWNVMIMGYGIHGDASKAIELFDNMKKQCLKPDAFTYIGILMACNHAGLVEDGLRYFEEMRNKRHIEPKLEHYSCVVDMLGRAGQLANAMRLVEEMPEEPDSRIWSALLSACKIHNDVDFGETVAEKLLELEPDKVEHYVMASNLFAGSGRWDDVRRIRKKMKENGLHKDPGCSWMELEGKIYDFTVGEEK